MLWGLLLLAAYPYLIYAMLIRATATLRRRPVAAKPVEPTVTVVIAAYNEQDAIERTVLNKLEQDYPADKLSVVVVSDGSDDDTDRILARLRDGDERLRVMRQGPRQGKTAALNMAIADVATDIVVFSDANSHYERDAVRKLVRSFADPEVGYVTGRMVYTNASGEAADDGGGAYIRYEDRLRAWESQVGSIVGVDGGIDAIRRSLYQPMQPDQLPDFVLPLSVVEAGFRVVCDRDAVVYEASLEAGGSELKMRVRVALRALWAIWDKRCLLNPFRYPLYSWQLLSHKLLRYLSVYPLLAAAVLAVVRAGQSPGHLLVAIAFAAGLLAALLGTIAPFRNMRLIAFSHYFAVLNIASLLASLKFLKRERIIIWRPRLG